ncbi:NCS1 family nucleobase:cation symporter-1 [Amycolatopsis azurea]|uniref:Cytosine/purine/uracil/thiamine/allantoin permease family protein n=1 Tax=Amycolatopsis azurea DSM 43854 TaxID=1238180 RepID=M2PUN9_9PSEU|nr:NCS1 family nucleobase:cation symporter-1 [Amycolatopsis azurea]EMD28338.1 Cytosine/purine/uracil/thiamine/allantoin permease family protein [Amycolatopsis azurea DSM 43854]OOC06560.1 nitrate reductase [Amycolatopsis azurea DSM 43854]
MTAAPATRTEATAADQPDPRLWNEDLAPAKDRRWKVYDIFALWMSDVHNLGNYTFAAGLFVLGLSAWQVFTALLTGFVLIYFGMNLMGRIGQRTGVPFPVVARISFGTFGANLPALIRAIIAIFWYGIQTYLASVAITLLVLAIDPGLKPLTEVGFLGLHALGWICFIALWLAQALVLTRGMEAVRKFQDWCGPGIWIVMIALAVWVLAAADWNISLTGNPKALSTGEQVRQWFGAVGLILSIYGTLMLNFCDFSRFAPNQKTVRRGNFWGLPINSTAFALLSVLVTAGSLQVFGEAITEPAELLARIDNTPVLIIGALTFAIATMGVNIVANFVSPAYDLANIWPKRITFTIGGMISAVAALCVLPWKLYSSPAVVNYFLGGLGAFLGPLFGIMIVDYYLVKRGRIDVGKLFVAGPDSPYHYNRGFNPRAMVTFLPTAALSAVIALVPFFAPAAPYSWFIGTASAAALYFAVSRKQRVA